MRYYSNSLYRQLITSARWNKLRKYKLIQNPICERCHEKLASEVHHIEPLNKFRDDPKLMEIKCFDIDNLQALCKDCHIQTHIELGKFHNRDMQALHKEQVENFKKNYF